MTETSRLDAARQEADAVGPWFRSPLALLAGLILFIGALALVVLSVTGDETSDTQLAAGDAAAPADTAQEVPRISFGGVDIPETDTVTLSAAPLPVLTDDDDDAAVGTLAPQITATSLANGNPITLGPGRARVIGFFAHWCSHCQRELPEVTEWLANTELPPNSEFIAVSTAVDEASDNYPPSAWFTEVGFGAPVVVDDANGTFLSGMGFTGFPAFIAIDASGAVVARASGNIGTDGVAELFSHFAS